MWYAAVFPPALGQALKVNPPVHCVASNAREHTPFLEDYGGIILLLLWLWRNWRREDQERPKKRQRTRYTLGLTIRLRGGTGDSDIPEPPLPPPGEEGRDEGAPPAATPTGQPPEPPPANARLRGGPGDLNIPVPPLPPTAEEEQYEEDPAADPPPPEPPPEPPPAAPAEQPLLLQRIKIATFNIISGRQSRLEMALRAMGKMNVDLGFFTEAKLTDGHHTRNFSEYSVLSPTVLHGQVYGLRLIHLLKGCNILLLLGFVFVFGLVISLVFT